ncbi:MAG: glutamate-1-semialdehyde 2,1-aminomutase [Microscillaceae bacterium]|nr:glutamate-1-semialdehyde 2,1-aminomutase [Microscillaceae bacterium]MDW8460150.1 glutamate-1-semialdehyde 2,1-aminomutase [Cytophagales bacterium]
MQPTLKSQQLFEKAQKLIPGGVNSPVRAFRSVGGNPLFIKSAKGAYIYDEDGNAYIELINSWGPMILGHAHESIQEAIRDALQYSFSFGAPTAKEVQIAELVVEMCPSIEMVRFVNSGTEACMSAIRAARGYTGREKIIKFEGCYHGHGDAFLIAAGSGAMTTGIPDSAGITQGVAKDTLTAAFNNLEQVQQLVEANPNQIAAIIIEPVVGNMGLVLPQQGFLEGLRAICNKENIVLIFDEVMTGFRLAKGGAQERLGVIPDMTTLGKIIGGGLPVGAYGGKADIMKCVSPVGKVYQAGTLSGNPIAISAGLATLTYLKENPDVYQTLENIGTQLVNGLRAVNRKLGLNYTINHIGSMYSLFFTEKPVYDLASAKTSDTNLFAQYFKAMLKRGIYLAPSQFESLFLSIALTPDLIEQIIYAHEQSLREVLELK